VKRLVEGGLMTTNPHLPFIPVHNTGNAGFLT
jgi:hypothetical protein